MGLLAEPGDRVLIDDMFPAAVPSILEHVRWTTFKEACGLNSVSQVIPWGWDAPARELAGRFSSDQPVPSDEVVRRVNGRRFLSDFDLVHPAESKEQRFFGRLCASESDVLSYIDYLASSGSRSWILKAELSTAGRQTLRGFGVDLSDSQQGWLRRQLNAAGWVYAEPLAVIAQECGLQFDITPGGREVTFLGAVELLTTPRGGYRGSRLTRTTDPVWEPAVQHGTEVARAAADQGYFGPLGIDAMLVKCARDAEQLPASEDAWQLRLCHDINARLTMGRLALTLKPLLGPDEEGIWLHRKATENPEDLLDSELFPASRAAKIVRTVPTSPTITGGRPALLITELLITDHCPE